MSPRKQTVDGLDDIDDEDGTVEEEVRRPSDLSLDMQLAEDVGLGGTMIDEEEERHLRKFAAEDEADQEKDGPEGREGKR